MLAAMSPPPSRPPTSEPAIRVVMMPRDANANHTIFGGVILSYIDQAGFVECCRQSPHRYVTVAMDKVEFHQPVCIGDIVSFYAQAVKVGRTSITVKVTVKADRLRTPSPGAGPVTVTEAQLVYVAIDDDGKPVAVFD
jgi:acyl-CoA thioesterase YciA